MVTKSKNKTQNKIQNKTENNQNMKKTEHNELLSFLRVFDVLVQYCLTSWSSPTPRRLWRQKNFNCSPGLSFLLMYRSNRSFDVLPRTNPWVFELLNIGLCKSPPPPPRGKIVQMPHPPNFFVKTKSPQERLDTFGSNSPPQPGKRSNSLAAEHGRRSNASGLPVRCWDERLSLTVFDCIYTYW